MHALPCGAIAPRSSPESSSPCPLSAKRQHSVSTSPRCTDTNPRRHRTSTMGESDLGSTRLACMATVTGGSGARGCAMARLPRMLENFLRVNSAETSTRARVSRPLALQPRASLTLTHALGFDHVEQHQSLVVHCRGHLARRAVSTRCESCTP